MSPLHESLDAAAKACEEARCSLYMAGDPDDALIKLLKELSDRLAVRAQEGESAS